MKSALSYFINMVFIILFFLVLILVLSHAVDQFGIVWNPSSSNMCRVK